MGGGSGEGQRSQSGVWYCVGTQWKSNEGVRVGCSVGPEGVVVWDMSLL